MFVEKSVHLFFRIRLNYYLFVQTDGICSYHVFKSSSQHFPFTIDIIDKSTGEAIIQAVRKDPPTTPQQQQQQEQSQLESAAATVFNFTKSKQHGVQHHSIVLDCNKNKEFNFLLQAYDCSDPPQSSKKYVQSETGSIIYQKKLFS